MPRDSIFPPVDPFLTGYLQADDLHSLYWEQCGNPDGVPVVFLHGGPGAGASPVHRRFFDPDHYRIVIFDQRGAGRSRPLGELRDNTTDHLVDDLEALRRHFAIDRWHIFGGSWGSTLGMAYAQVHPQRCLSPTLRGIFLMRRTEIDWFLSVADGSIHYYKSNINKKMMFFDCQIGFWEVSRSGEGIMPQKKNYSPSSFSALPPNIPVFSSCGIFNFSMLPSIFSMLPIWWG